MDASGADFDNLIRLQELDARIRHASLFLDSLPRLVDEIEQKIKAGSAAVAAARERLSRNQKSRRDLETEVKDAKGQISKFKRQLNDVKTNREYTSLLHEIEEMQRAVDAQEEKIIAEMLAADDIEQEIQAALRQQTRDEAELRKDQEVLQAKKREMEETLRGLQAERDAVVPRIRPELLRVYTSIAGKKSGVAMSEVKGDFCATCHMRIRPQMINEIRQRVETILCENCGRILYWDTRPEAAAAEGDKAKPAEPGAEPPADDKTP